MLIRDHRHCSGTHPSGLRSPEPVAVPPPAQDDQPSLYPLRPGQVAREPRSQTPAGRATWCGCGKRGSSRPLTRVLALRHPSRRTIQMRWCGPGQPDSPHRTSRHRPALPCPGGQRAPLRGASAHAAPTAPGACRTLSYAVHRCRGLRTGPPVPGRAVPAAAPPRGPPRPAGLLRAAVCVTPVPASAAPETPAPAAPAPAGLHPPVSSPCPPREAPLPPAGRGSTHTDGDCGHWLLCQGLWCPGQGVWLVLEP